MSERRPRRLFGQHPLRWVLLIAALTLAAVFLTPKASRAIGDLHHLHDANQWWLAVSVAAEAASLLAFSFGTWTLIEPGSRPRFTRVVRLDLVTVALSHAVPAGSAAGTALGYELLEEEGVGPVESGFVKVSQSLLATMVLQVLLGVALTLKMATYGTNLTNAGLGAAGGVLLLLTLVFFWMLGYRPEAVRRIAVRVLRPIPRVPEERVGEVILEFSGHLRALLATPTRLAVVCLWSAGNWLFDLASLWFALHAFGAAVNPVLVGVGFFVAQVAALLPISPAGLGVVEGSLVPLLISFGVASPVALLGVLAWRLVNFWLPLPIGGAAYLLILADRRRRARNRRPVAQPITES